MPAYVYPIKIKPEKQVIRYTEQHSLNDNILTLGQLRNYVGENELFSIEEDYHGSSYTLTVYKQRLETDVEQALRTAKDTKYMAEYNKRHSNQ